MAARERHSGSIPRWGGGPLVADNAAALRPPPASVFSRPGMRLFRPFPPNTIADGLAVRVPEMRHWTAS